MSVFPPASLPSLADATASTRSGALQDGENILRKWSRYLMSAALDSEDRAANIGIRIVLGVAQDVHYQNLLGLNVLTMRV